MMPRCMYATYSPSLLALIQKIGTAITHILATARYQRFIEFLYCRRRCMVYFIDEYIRGLQHIHTIYTIEMLSIEFITFSYTPKDRGLE